MKRMDVKEDDGNMKRKQNGRLFMIAAVLLIMAGGLSSMTGNSPGKVQASETAGQNQEVQSLAEFRRAVAASVRETAEWISRNVIASAGGSAGGRLIPSLKEGENQESERQNQTSDQASRKAASAGKAPYDPYNVYDYDSADAFADDYAEEFAEEFFDDESSEEAYEDGYDEACDYWESRHR